MPLDRPSYFVTGGAGFVGSSLVRRLLETTSGRVTVFDNFSTGRRQYLPNQSGDRLTIVEGSCQNQQQLLKAIPGHGVVFHLASNSDIARAAKEPEIDFENGTVLTHNVLEAMRKNNIKRIVFPSGSGVYGDVPPTPVPEDFPRMVPVSTYGACKLASEALISAYAFMFDMQGTVFRFANVVGPRQTHGVAYDFIQRLVKEPSRLLIYGDGTQSKPYIHIDDVLDAFMRMSRERQSGYEYYNVASEDHLTVNDIAEIVVRKMGLKDVKYEYTGGSRGWKADVPLYRLDTRKIRAQGWSNRRNSRAAVEASVEAMLSEVNWKVN